MISTRVEVGIVEKSLKYYLNFVTLKPKFKVVLHARCARRNIHCTKGLVGKKSLYRGFQIILVGRQLLSRKLFDTDGHLSSAY